MTDRSPAGHSRPGHARSTPGGRLSLVRTGGPGTGTLGDGSVLGAIRAAEWPVIRVGRLQMLAAVAALGDVLTTYVIVTAEAYTEYNPLVDALAGDAVAIAMLYFVALNAWYMALGSLDLGWLSTATATFHALLMGSATVNNLVLFAAGTSPIDVLGGTVAYRAKLPVVAVVALVVAVRCNDRPPTAELLAVGAVLLVGALLH